MKVIEKGDGEPELVVVGSVHGDEPAGKKAINRLLEEDHEFNKPVKFIIANEKALEKNVRYTEVDLNSSFPGNPDSDLYEERLAAKITEHTEGQKVIDLHTTKSTEEPFVNVKNLEEETREMVRDTGVNNSVCFPEDSGVLMETASKAVLVETGPQGTERAAEKSLEVLKNFLSCQGVINGKCERNDPDFFRYLDTVEGDWIFEAENFKKVESGEIYASKEIGEVLEAERDFYPVLMSTNGYNGKLGYMAEKVEDF